MPTDFRQIARQKAQKYGLLPEVFERQIEAESGFNPKAVSEAGACGIAQIMPSTARGWGVDCTDPEASLEAAAENMAAYIKTYLGGKRPGEERDPVKLRQGYEKGLRAYNAGPGAVEASKRYAETNAYVNKIIGPDKFSFTEALGAKEPPKTEQQPQQTGGRTFLIFKDIPAQVDPRKYLGNFLFKNDGLMKLPVLKPSFNPLELLAQAAMQTPNYLGDEV
jgi:hypothetical protein